LSKIEWTDETWNPVTGCTKVSAGCDHCYAERMSRRLRSMGLPEYRYGFRVTCHEHKLELPLAWTRPRMVFVDSMGDLFHEAVPLDFIRRVFDVMVEATWHRFQVLTKRAERLAAVAPELPWPKNIWMGVTVENETVLGRAVLLGRVPAAVRFVSCEPLLGSMDGLELAGLDWVIAGGETGPSARAPEHDWVANLCHRCTRAGVAFFFKGWGGRTKARGRLLDGRLWGQYPDEVPR
jgi:protein gp37